MNCYKFQDHIRDYIEKELDFGLQRELTEHLEKCESCRSQLAETKELILKLNELPELHCSADFDAKLLARIQQEKLSQSRKSQARWIPFSRNLSVAAAVILLITASWLSVNWLNPNIQQPQVPISKLLEESGQKGQPLQQLTMPVNYKQPDTETENDSSQTMDRRFQPRIQLVNEQE